MLSKAKGDLAVANAIQYYMSNDYEVCLPIGDKRPYDLVVEHEGHIKRVQVKFAGFYNGIQQHKAALRITGGNQSRKSVKKYTEDDFDELFVFTASGRKFALPWKMITARNELNIENAKYSQYEIA
jgi:hypothetical protein